jgi:hypothetical protein
MASLSDVAEVRERYGSLQRALETVDTERIEQLISENRRLREEIDELRREGRYVAELYDLVLERVRADAKS